MLFLFFLILWPVAELFVAVKVAESIGALLTILLLLASWPVGSWLLRSTGRQAWQRLSAAVAEGRPPGRPVIDGALAVAGGVLFIVPGFITDVLGAALLLSPIRNLARRLIERNFRSRLMVRATRFPGRPPSDYDVDSTAHDVDPRHLHG
jgi:UPF0716 protein FxsA